MRGQTGPDVGGVAVRLPSFVRASRRRTLQLLGIGGGFHSVGVRAGADRTGRGQRCGPPPFLRQGEQKADPTTTGDWRGISFGRCPCRTDKSGRGRRCSPPQKADPTTTAEIERVGLGEFGDFFVEVSQGSLKRFAVVRIGGRLKLIHHASARQLEAAALLLAREVLSRLLFLFRFCLRGPSSFHLRFDVLAFPSTSHKRSVPQAAGKKPLYVRACA